MRTLIPLALLLAGCSSALTTQPVVVGPDPQAGRGLRVLAHFDGEFDVQALLETAPLSALIRAKGQATVTVRVLPPFVVIDGDADLVVEPAVGLEVAATSAVTKGEIVVTRDGVKGLLNKPGTIDAIRAQETPKPPPPTPAMKPVGCAGLTCKIPVFPLEK